MTKYTTFLFWISLCLITLCSSWYVMKSADFMYEANYKIIKIDQTILEFVPKNKKGKQNYPTSNYSQHKANFIQIVNAIHNEQDLKSIKYQGNQFLTEAEIIHLKDVTNLLTFLNYIFYGAVIILLLCIFFIKKTKTTISFLIFIKYSVLIGVILGVVLAVIGTKEIFYYLHTVVFPDNHQWFFYYEESLMSTIMQAPNIFGLIAIELVVTSIVIFAVLYWLIKKTLIH